MEVPQGNQGDVQDQGGAEIHMEVPQGYQGDVQVQRGTDTVCNFRKEIQMKDNHSDKVGSVAEFFLEGISDQSKSSLVEKKKSWKGIQQILQ